MKLYFAGYSSYKNELASIPEAENLLESYVVFRNKNFAEWHKIHNLQNNRNLFLDSGAFSALNLKLKLDINRYAEFIKTYKYMLEVYANLDVIGDAKATQKNQAHLESLGLSPLPTFHYMSDLRELDRLCRTYKYIALGGLVPISKQRERLKSWLTKCFQIILPYKTKVHGFGVGAFWLWELFPWYSVDATTWLNGGKFGEIGKFSTSNFIKKDVKRISKRFTTKLNVKDQFYLYKKDTSFLTKFNIQEYKKAADYCTKLWEKRGFHYT